MQLIVDDCGRPARCAAPSRRAGGRWRWLIALVTCFGLCVPGGCVVGQPDDRSGDGAGADAQGGAVEPTEGGAAGPPEAVPDNPPEPPGDGGASGPGEPAPGQPLPGGLTPEELSACANVPATDDAAVAALDDPAAQSAGSNGAADPSIAAEFDAAAEEVEASISALPAGPVREAVVDYLAVQRAVSDALRSDEHPSGAQIAAAERTLTAACAAG